MSNTEFAPSRIIDSRHPSFMSGMNEWEKWRLCYRGGDEFKNKYLEQFSTREDRPDFDLRRKLTPIPAFAKAAINDIRNSIFQRMRDILRVGGSEGYRNAVAGNDLGVDRRGMGMNAFLGNKVLTELLVMARCGVYVDNSVVIGETLADAKDARPYLYPYQIEDILSWTCSKPDSPSEFQAILLRDTATNYDRRTLLPLTTFERFRLLWIDEETGKVNLQFYDNQGNAIDRDGGKSLGPTVLDLYRIPFVMFDIGDSLVKDVCSYQISLLNSLSRAVWYDLQSNFPFYIEQRDLRAIGTHLKNAASEDGTATAGGQGAGDQNVVVGANHGRAYGKDLDAPSFIHPSSEPLKASIVLQEKLEGDIRRLVNLAVASMGARGSAESKAMDNQGLEAGLSFIGLVLESGERQIAEHWAAYENRNPDEREVATIKYPDRYSLKTDADRIDESTKLSKLIYSVPGRIAKQEISKNIVTVLLGGKVSVSVIDSIHNEIDKSDYLTSDPDTIIQAVEAGLCGDKTGSQALGFKEGEHLVAADDHAARAKRVAEAQATVSADAGLDNPAARGVNDLATDKKGAVAEKKAAADNTLRADRSSRQRGNSQSAPVTGKAPKGE